MAFKIKDGVRVGTVDVFNNAGVLLANAPTATALATARNINGVAFDGTAAITVKASTTNALTIGTGLSGSSFDGGSAVTIAIDSTVATLTGSQTLTNKTLTSPVMTTPTLGVASATSINKVTITAPATSSTLTIADGKTLTASNTLTFTGTDASSVAFGAGGTVAYTANKLSAFAATTSAELAGVISDETGTGALVFAGSPSLTTPSLGVATATSINKVAFTAPATGATLTIAEGKTLTASNTLTFTGTDSSSVAFGGGGTVAYVANKLSVFAATSSSELAGVISDETGSGALVFANTPTLVTPVITTSVQVPLVIGSTTASGQLTLRSTSNATKATAGVLMDDGIASSSTTTGTLVVTGGVGVSGALNVGGNTNIGGNLVLTGNLTVNGTTTTVNTTNLEISDPIIYLAQGNSANANDIGVVGHFDNGTYQHTGFVRDASDGIWKLFSGVAGEPSGTVDFTTYTSDKLEALQFISKATTGTAPLVVASTTEVANLRSATSTKLHTARTINGVSFDGTADITISSAAANALTIGTGLSGTSYNGSTAITIAIDSTVATLAGTQTLTNKSLGDFNQKTGSTTIAGNAVVQATVAATTATSVDSWAIATYRAAKYLVQITQGSNYQVSEILVIHNGTTTYMTEYGVIETNGSLGTFTSDISTGNARLLVTMGSATSATINIQRTAVVV